MATVKSAKGVLVDFDLLKIKQQIASAPKTTNVQAREDFIDKKFKRRLKKLTAEVIDNQSAGGVDPSVPPVVPVVPKP
jgi:aspartate-semialdehyde dehydrogenase